MTSLRGHGCISRPRIGNKEPEAVIRALCAWCGEADWLEEPVNPAECVPVAPLDVQGKRKYLTFK